MQKLEFDFFNQSTLIVAEQLLGKVLVFKKFRGVITETEAYRGADDPASHAFRGITPRNHIMFGDPGYSYVYLIYGMYFNLNFVTESKGTPGGVLIRGIKLLDKAQTHLDGPGKICRHLGITKAHYGINVTTSKSLYVGCINQQFNCIKTPRIGIKVGTDKLWRFLAKI